MDLGLNGKVAIVTGASKGIGREIAFELAREGEMFSSDFCGAGACGPSAFNWS